MENIKDRNDRTVNLWNTRKYQGIKVADIQDIIDYGNQFWGGGSGGGYQPDYTTIGLTTNNELAVRDYVSKTYVDKFIDLANDTFNDVYDKLSKQDIRFGTQLIEGAETIYSLRKDGIDYNLPVGSGGTVYWGNLAYSSDNKETIEVYLQRLYCPESFAVELDERLESLELDTIPNIEGDIQQLESELSVITPKVERALLIPTSTVASNELVGISPSKAQTRITIGAGLKIENNQLINTGSSGGNPLYLHTFEFVDNDGFKYHCRSINASPSGYNTISDVFNDVSHIVNLVGTKAGSSLGEINLYFLGSTQPQTHEIFLIGYSESNISDKVLAVYDCSSLVNWDTVELGA